jgi:acyl-coenzyme A synthetase/AMP-(fatty) acid ligase
MYGLGAEFLPAVMAGAAIDLQNKMNVLKYLEREKRFKPTIAFVTPTICDMLLKGFKTQRTGYKMIVTSGQRIGEELFCAFDERVNGCLVNQYGSSEMGAIAACDPADAQDNKATTIGKPMAGVQLMIGTDEGITHATADGSGELFCQHPYGFLGYVDEDGAWLQRAAPTSWYNTGDLARSLPHGSIQVTGRAGNSVNRRGYLVQFADLEQRMEGIQDVAQVVVVRAPGESAHGERIAAFCVLSQPATLNQLQVRERCFERLPAYAIPDDIFILDALPLLPSGKVDRQRLAALAK